MKNKHTIAYWFLRFRISQSPDNDFSSLSAYIRKRKLWCSKWKIHGTSCYMWCLACKNTHQFLKLIIWREARERRGKYKLPCQMIRFNVLTSNFPKNFTTTEKCWVSAFTGNVLSLLWILAKTFLSILFDKVSSLLTLTLLSCYLLSLTKSIN